jgi:hypothetical protein
MVFLSCTLVPEALASSLPAPQIVDSTARGDLGADYTETIPEPEKRELLPASVASTSIQPDSVALEKEFGTPEFAEGIPYSKFISYIRDDITRKYFSLWMEIFKSHNGLTEDDVETKVLFVKASNTGPTGEVDYFEVSYFAVMDWLKIKPATIGFPIIWPPNREEYKYLSLRTGVYLEQDEIMKYLTVGHNDSSFRVELKKPLAFQRKEEALVALQQGLEIDQIPNDKAVFEFLDGTPVVTAFVAFEKTKNHCKLGRLNLITGQVNVSRQRCKIIN